jgi:hypothetical protein
MQDSESEVARIRQQISEELEAMQRGFSGFAAGMARHDFIHARMEQIGNHQEELAGYVGEQDAVDMVCALYIDKVDGKRGK